MDSFAEVIQIPHKYPNAHITSVMNHIGNDALACCQIASKRDRFSRRIPTPLGVRDNVSDMSGSDRCGFSGERVDRARGFNRCEQIRVFLREPAALVGPATFGFDDQAFEPPTSLIRM